MERLWTSITRSGLPGSVRFGRRIPAGIGMLSALDRKTPDEFYYERLPTLHHAVRAETGRTARMKQEILSNRMGPPLGAQTKERPR